MATAAPRNERQQHGSEEKEVSSRVQTEKFNYPEEEKKSQLNDIRCLNYL